LPSDPHIDRLQALHHHLRDNESECVRSNIIVHVDEISAEQNVAFCSVEQRLFGLCRRPRSAPELIWRAEQALTPLIGLGIIPLITVRPVNPAPARSGRSFMDWLPRLWRWMGYPLSPTGLGSVLLAHDPFGWRRAMTASATT
jgi:hypothetical protein